MGGTYKKPHTWTPGDEITVERENAYTDNDEYFKQKTDELEAGDETHRTAVPIDHPDDSIPPVKIQAIDAPVDGEVPSYNEAEGKFEWRPAPVPPPIDVGLELYGYKGILLRWQHWLPEYCTDHTFTGSGAFEWYSNRVTLSTGFTPGSTAAVYKMLAANAFASPTWDKPRRLAVRLNPLTLFEEREYIITGGLEGPELINNTFRHFGFYIVAGSVYGTVGNGTVQRTELLVELTDPNVPVSLEAHFDLSKVDFYVNGELKWTTMVNLPSGTTDADQGFTCSIVSTDPNGHDLDIYAIHLLQEK